MKIVALFVALLLERLATHLFHWRELRWLDPLFDFGLRQSSRWQSISPYLWVIVTVALAAAPVLLFRLALDDALLGLPYLVLSVIVLFLSLGPQDIGEEVDCWRRAIDEGDYGVERNYARALLERAFNDTAGVRAAVPGAVFVQANNRMFAVIFWFIVLGPVGAWAFRVTDLVRRRALFQAQRAAVNDVAEDSGLCADTVHAVLAWVPARLTALGYILAGHYDAGREAWREASANRQRTLSATNANLLASVGLAALQQPRSDTDNDAQWATTAARAAKNLALRTLGFWLVGIAVLTLVGFAI